MKPNEKLCLAKLNVTDVPELLLLSQHKSGLAFNFPLSTLECDPFWKSARKHYIFRAGRTRETFYM